MLKKACPLLFLFIIAYSLIGCNSNKTGQGVATTGNTSVMVKEAEKTTNTISLANYMAMPDTALLGKSYEAKVKLVDASLIPLQDPNGKSIGSELTIKLSLTNKSTLDDKKFFSVSPADARLEMDNGLEIQVSHNSGKTKPDPESSCSAEWKFDLPPNTKPAKLHFYLDGTRVTLNLQTK